MLCGHRRGVDWCTGQAAPPRQRGGEWRDRSRRPGEGAGRRDASRSAPARAASSSRGTIGGCWSPWRARPSPRPEPAQSPRLYPRAAERPGSPLSTSPPARSPSRSPRRPLRSPSTFCPMDRPRISRTARPTRSSSSTSPLDWSRRRRPSARSLKASPSDADGKVLYVATHGADEISAIDPKRMTPPRAHRRRLAATDGPVRATRGDGVRHRRGEPDHHDHRREANISSSSSSSSRGCPNEARPSRCSRPFSPPMASAST